MMHGSRESRMPIRICEESTRRKMSERNGLSPCWKIWVRSWLFRNSG